MLLSGAMFPRLFPYVFVCLAQTDFWRMAYAQSTEKEFWLTIDHGTVSPDGVPKSMLLFNQSYPGPEIRVQKDDYVCIHVRNQLCEATTVHFHGMFFPGTPDMDGAAMITQFPIAPNATFTYRFQVKDQAGTYWYHSHAGAQYIDGLVGPFVIDDPSDPHRSLYDEELTLYLTDHYHNTSSELLQSYLTPQSMGNEPVPDNGLINGHNVFNCTLLTTTEQQSACTGGYLTNFTVQAGRWYRLRITNAGAFTSFQVSVPGLKLVMIEADGINLKPKQLDRFQINVGQRYSVVLAIPKDYSGRSIQFLAAMQTEYYAGNVPDSLNPNITAILNVSGASSVDQWMSPTQGDDESASNHCQDCDFETDGQFVPLAAKRAPGPVTQRIHLNISFGPNDQNINVAFINNRTFEAPRIPPLYDIMANRTQLPAGIYPVYLPLGSVVELVLNNYDEGEHPFHLHGHAFSLLGYGKHGEFDRRTMNHLLNYRNPPRRDTFSLQEGGWAVIRFVANNPGVWLFHCHIEWHIMVGLAMTFVVTDGLPGRWPSNDGEWQRYLDDRNLA